MRRGGAVRWPSIGRSTPRASDKHGQFTLVDPLPETHQIVAGLLPAGVAFHSVGAPIQEAELPEVDVVTCSLVLHHSVGIYADERRRHGLSGPGKRETLARLVAVLCPRRGIGILTEADTYHDLALLPGDPLLLERFMESYVRRSATMVADAIAHVDADAALRQPCPSQSVSGWRLVSGMLPRPSSHLSNRSSLDGIESILVTMVMRLLGVMLILVLLVVVVTVSQFVVRMFMGMPEGAMLPLTHAQNASSVMVTDMVMIVRMELSRMGMGGLLSFALNLLLWCCHR